MVPSLQTIGCASLLLAPLCSPAAADLQLCNRTSYVVETALGIEDKGSAATRGWFRIDPGQCRAVMQGTVDAERADLCIAEGTFLVAGARHCTKSGQRLVRFTEVKPTETEQGLTANLAEEADYSAEQARLAGIQRLLVNAGYDATPIDGLEGRKTEAALAQFLKDRGLASDAASAPAFFDTLINSAKQADGIGFTWCNETPHTVMAVFGVEEKGLVVTRGWYRIESGKCLKPDLSGKPRRLYSFAEAVDGNGHAVKRAEKPLSWG